MSLTKSIIQNISYWKERVDLAAAFRWAARFDLHEGVANHFSFSINDDGTKFLMNPNQVHFSRIKASELIVVDANDTDTLNLPGAPDPPLGACTVQFIETVFMPDAQCMFIPSMRPLLPA